MPNRIDGTQHEDDRAAARRPWQTPDLEETDVRETADGVPPVTGPGDGVNAYS
jgi:hypothetical protein